MTVGLSIESLAMGDVIVRLSGQAHDQWDGVAEQVRTGVASAGRRGRVIVDLSDVVLAHPLSVVVLARRLAVDFGAGAVRLVCPRLPARRLLRRMLADVPVGLLPSLETALAECDPESVVAAAGAAPSRQLEPA